MADNIASELHRMENWIGGITANLSPSKRAQVSRRIANTLRGTNAKNIARQREADGNAFTARKTAAPLKPSARAKKFIYPSGGSGIGRTVLLKSWVKKGHIYTGFDVEAGAIRSFDKSKIIKYLSVSNEEQNKNAPKRKSTIKSRLMFRKLRTFGKLRASSNANMAQAGYSGKDAEIASVHQFGGIDQVHKNGPSVKYEQRKLLGLSKEAENQILNMLVAMIDPPNI